MKRFLAAALAAALLGGCGNADETYRPAGYIDPVSQAESTFVTEISRPAAAHVSNSAASSSAAPAPNGVLRQTFSSEDDALIFTVENLFSGGEYYTVTAAATRTDVESKSTIYINGELYGEPLLTLYKDGRQTGVLKLGIPDGDRFITLESAAENYSYGGEIISNKREFGAEEYPDILGFVFRSGSPEAAVPEYTRYFAVFEDKLTELAIRENGSKVDPRGTKLEPVSAGVAKQFLTVLKSGGGGYEVIKYEYVFDVDNKCLNKKQVKFYGWDY